MYIIYIRISANKSLKNHLHRKIIPILNHRDKKLHAGQYKTRREHRVLIIRYSLHFLYFYLSQCL